MASGTATVSSSVTAGKSRGGAPPPFLFFERFGETLRADLAVTVVVELSPLPFGAMEGVLAIG
jgi:hypothetical protein